MMDTNLWLNNVAGYSLQVAVLVAVGSLLPILLRFRRPRIMLAYWQVLLATCLLLPAIQTWQAIPAGQAAQAGRAESEFALTGAGYEIDSLLLATFGAGVLIRLSWLAIGLVRLRSYRRKARQIAPLPALLEKLQSLTGARARICLFAKIHSPVTFGVSRPVILLPTGFLEMEEKHQEAIACHELLHVRRSDWLFTLFEEAVRSFLWFHPAIWWVLGRIQLAREQLVDRQTIEITRARKPYLEALAQMASARLDPQASAVLPFSRKPHLTQRVGLIVNEEPMSKLRVSVSLTAILGFFALAVQLALSSCSLQTPQPDETSDTELRIKVDMTSVDSFETPQLDETSGAELRIQLDDKSVMRVRAYRASDEGVRSRSPRLLHKVEPDYTDEAKDAKIEGTVVLAIEVGPDGKAHNLQILRSLNEGLDNNAIEAVRQWEFKPGMKGGESVTVRANVEVNYRLLDEE